MTPLGSTYPYRQCIGVPPLPRGLTKRFSKDLRFKDSGGFFYKTKTPLISRQLASDKAF